MERNDPLPKEESSCSTAECSSSSISKASPSIDELVVSILGFRRISRKYESFIAFRLLTQTTRSEFPKPRSEVERRYSEFEWLHARIARTYPACFIPPLPGKMLKTTLDRFSEPLLNYRSTRLSSFLRRLTRHQILSADPDLLAFLTLDFEDFKAYQSSHSAPGALSTLLMSFVMANDPTEVPSDPHSPRPTKVETSLIVPDAIRPYEEEFRGFSEEVESFFQITQRLSRSTEFISKHMEHLSTEFANLAGCLHAWPFGLTLLNENYSTCDNHKIITSGRRLDWTRSRPLAVSQVAKACQTISHETIQLADMLRTVSTPSWQDVADYAQSVRNILGTRVDLENRYIDAVELVRSETSASHQGDASNRPYKNYLVWRKRPTSELIMNANRLQDRVTFVNHQIRSEFDRWSLERRQEAVHSLRQMAEAYANYWTRTADAWRLCSMDVGSFTDFVPEATPPALSQPEKNSRDCLNSPASTVTPFNVTDPLAANSRA